MSTAGAHPEVYTAQAVASMSPQILAQLLQTKAATIAELQRQLDWFRRQLFGQKSERFAPEPDPQQMHLGELMPAPVLAVAPTPAAEHDVPAHKRRKPRSDFADDAAGVPFFDEARVPVQTIEVPNPEVQGLSTEEAARQYELVGHKVSHRLAQRPGAFVVLKYVRPIVKRRDTQTLHCPAAPAGVIEGSRADVSFIAGLLVDKFRYHLPLYRQHQRLLDAGFTLSRPWLTQLVQHGAQLLEPIFDAQLGSICAGHVITMDEVPVKAGVAGKGKMKASYFWPVYGEHDEVCFPHFESRRHEHVQQALGAKLAPGTVLLSDGYAAYAAYAKTTGITHAQCWAHSRRCIFEAKDVEPQAASQALEQIAALYKVEEHIRQHKLAGDAKRLHRLTHSKPLVERFFDWVDKQFEQLGLLPSNPLIKALAYVRERRAGLSVFLEDPAVAIGRVEMWRGGRRSGLSVSAPFVWRCPSTLAVAPSPHPPRRTGRAGFPHPALFRRIRPSRSSGRVQAAAGVSVPTSRTGTGRNIGGTPFPACRCVVAARSAVAARCSRRWTGRSLSPVPD